MSTFRGELHEQIGNPNKSIDAALLAAGRLLHAQGFDRVPNAVHRSAQPAHEVRCSASCREPGCNAVWIGTKGGQVHRFGVGDAGVQPRQIEYAHGVRALLHLHRGDAFGGQSILLVGSDVGYLYFLDAKTTNSIREPIRVDQWWTASKRDIEPGAGLTFDDPPERHISGITAMAELDERRVLIATRRGELGVIEADGGRLSLRVLEGERSVGWIQWMLRIDGDDHITCVSRGGEITRVPLGIGADPAAKIEVAQLSLLPTAAMAFDDGLLLGTTEGLVSWRRDAPDKTLLVPVTRAAVLCLHAFETVGERPHRFVAFGLQTGRVRVIERSVVEKLVAGVTASPNAASYWMDLGAAVLALESLELPSSEPSTAGLLPNPCFLFAAGSDHEVRVLQFEDQDDIMTRVRNLGGKLDEEATWTSLLEAHDKDRSALEAIHYLRICAARSAQRDGLSPVALGREELVAMARSRSVAVRRLISRYIADLAKGDATLLIELSMELLRALPRRDDRSFREWVEQHHWIEQHLKLLHEAARELPNDAPRLIAWTRFVRKFVLDGDAFAQKERGLRHLVERNWGTGKFLDALIYQARLYQQRYDVDWSRKVPGALLSLLVTPSLVIAATHEGALWFFDRAGDPLKVAVSGAREGDSFTRDDDRLLAAAVVHESDEGRATARLVLSWKRPLAKDGSTIRVVEIEHLPGGRVSVTSDTEVSGKPELMHAYSFCRLPGHGTTVLVGLDAPELLFGVIRRAEGGWVLDQKRSGSPGPERAAERAANPVPARALAVADVKGAFQRLAVIGDDDGRLRFVWFDDGFVGAPARRGALNSAPEPQIHEVRLGSIRNVALLRDPQSGEGGEPLSHTCLVGTSQRETFAGTVLDAGGRPMPLWGEVYEGAVVTVTSWQDTDLYGKGVPVLVAATEKGRVCLYETRRSYGEKEKLTELRNYRFRGLRLDRIALPAPLSSLVLPSSASMVVDDEGQLVPGKKHDEFLAGGTEGRIFKGVICYARNALVREKGIAFPEQLGPPLPLPTNMWHRLEALRRNMGFGERFFPGEDTEARDFDLGGTVHLHEGGALRRYLLQRWLERYEHWSGKSKEEEIVSDARKLLSGLRSDIREERDLIKVVLKSMGEALLDRSPDGLVEAMRAGAPTGDERAGVMAAVRVLEERILYAASQPVEHAGRIRMTATKELLRVNVLRHIAAEAEPSSIRKAVEGALGECLRDESRLVRLEALRAIGVLLRNVHSLRGDRISEGVPLMAQLFPHGVDSIAWLLRLLTEDLQRYPKFSLDSLGSPVWHHIASIMPIFWLFPESTLRLCEEMVGAGVDTSVLAGLAQRLRSPRGSAESLTDRAEMRNAQAGMIESLYVVPLIAAEKPREAFINRYSMGRQLGAEVERWQTLLSSASRAASQEERDIAARWIGIYDRLAHGWSIQVAEKLDVLPALGPAPNDTMRGPSYVAWGTTGALVALGKQLAGSESTREQRAGLIEQFCKEKVEDAGLVRPVRLIVEQILRGWDESIRKGPPRVGEYVGKYKLEAWLGGGGVVTAYQAVASGKPFAVKVFDFVGDGAAERREHFVKRVELNQQLRDVDGVVKVVDLVGWDGDYPACVMDFAFDVNLDRFSRDWESARVLLALEVARSVSATLLRVHSKQVAHRNIHARNILVRHEADNRVYLLMDFAHPGGDVPTSRNITRDARVDVMALARVLYEVLTNEPFRDFGAALQTPSGLPASADKPVAEFIGLLSSALNDAAWTSSLGDAKHRLQSFVRIANQALGSFASGGEPEGSITDPGAQKRRELAEAFKSAFPTVGELRLMLHARNLVALLNRVNVNAALDALVWELIVLAESSEALDTLVDKAVEHNPGNRPLQAWLQRWRGKGSA